MVGRIRANSYNRTLALSVRWSFARACQLVEFTDAEVNLRDGEGEAWDPSYPDMSIDLFFFPQVVRAALVE